jgi:hypothetical protein
LGEHATGVQPPAGSLQTFGVPPTPHSSGDAQVPHSTVPPHESGICPQLPGTSPHVSGAQGHASCMSLAWQNASSPHDMPPGQSNVTRHLTVHGSSRAS